MNIQYLRMRNFYSYADEEIDFSKEGMYIIYGEDQFSKSRNGVGKTTIAEAIKYTLFNKTRTDSIDDCIKFGCKDMQVILRFTLEDKEIEIIRCRTKNKESQLTLTINGEHSNKQTNTDTDKYIEKLVGLTYDQFMHSFNYGQSEFDDLKTFTAKKLIDFLKTVLELERFDKYKEIAKEKVKQTETELNKLIGIKEAISSLVDTNVNKEKLQKNVELATQRKEKFLEQLGKIKAKLEVVREVEGIEASKATKIKTQMNKISEELKYISKTKKCPTCKRDLANDEVTTSKQLEYDKLLKEYEKQAEVILKTKNERKNFEDLQGNVESQISQTIEIYNENKSQLDIITKQEKYNKKDVEEKYNRFVKAKGVLEETVVLFDSKGIPLYLLNQSIPKLELLINKVLSQLCDFTIRIITEEEGKTTKKIKDTCKIKIYRGNVEYNLANLSSGQACLVNLAFRIGISKIFLHKSNFETLIIDEAFKELGEINQEKVIDLINILQELFKKIIIISHIDNIRDTFLRLGAEKIHVKYDGNTSSLLYNNSEDNLPKKGDENE